MKGIRKTVGGAQFPPKSARTLPLSTLDFLFSYLLQDH